MRAAEQSENMARFRILVVDDEPMVTEVVERYLVRDGFEVSTAADGDVAISLAQSWGPDLIVVGRRGQSPVKRWLLGSVSERIVHHASVPVLLVP